MNINKKYVLEYQKLYMNKFKIQLTYQESLKQCIDMVKLGKAVYRKIDQNKNEGETKKHQLKC